MFAWFTRAEVCLSRHSGNPLAKQRHPLTPTSPPILHPCTPTPPTYRHILPTQHVPPRFPLTLPASLPPHSYRHTASSHFPSSVSSLPCRHGDIAVTTCFFPCNNSLPFIMSPFLNPLPLITLDSPLLPLFHFPYLFPPFLPFFLDEGG